MSVSKNHPVDTSSMLRYLNAGNEYTYMRKKSLIYPWITWYTGWFLETDIFNSFISHYIKAYERFDYMENSLNRFPFWY